MFRRLIFALALFSAALTPVPARAGLLEDYVEKEDKAFGYEVKKVTTEFGVRALSVRLKIGRAHV